MADWWFNAAVAAGYYTSLGGLALCSLQRACLATRFHPTSPAPLPATLPHVTVQLPLYNEASVAARLIHAAAALDWPADRLHIQVLDDSTDETTQVVHALVTSYAQRGVRLEHVRRPSRNGFKAGALQHGLATATGSLIAIFDADFVPPRDFLRRLCGHFSDETVALVQARWDHLNAEHGLLTRVQSLMLDGHFAVEQAGRAAQQMCFNFNGTAGVWRRTAIEQAGGWRADTLTEDLDLSYRAQLLGWRFVYDHNTTAPAELPTQMTAFKGQQHRWTKGSIQTALHLLGALWRSPLTLRARLHATAHLLGNLAYVLLLVTALLLPVASPSVHALGWTRGWMLDSVLWLMGSGALAAFYAVAARRCGRSPWRALLMVFPLMALGAGMALSNAKGLLGGLLGIRSDFVRTPKQGGNRRPRYVARVGLLPVAELLLAAWLAAGAWLHALHGWYGTVPVQALFSAGVFWVALGSLRQLWMSTSSPMVTHIQASHVLHNAAAHSTASPSRRHTA